MVCLLWHRIIIIQTYGETVLTITGHDAGSRTTCVHGKLYIKDDITAFYSFDKRFKNVNLKKYNRCK